MVTRQVVIDYEDDFDGQPVLPEDRVQRSLVIDGEPYTIDLSADNSAFLTDLLREYVKNYVTSESRVFSLRPPVPATTPAPAPTRLTAVPPHVEPEDEPETASATAGKQTTCDAVLPDGSVCGKPDVKNMFQHKRLAHGIGGPSSADMAARSSRSNVAIRGLSPEQLKDLAAAPKTQEQHIEEEVAKAPPATDEQKATIQQAFATAPVEPAKAKKKPTAPKNTAATYELPEFLTDEFNPDKLAFWCKRDDPACQAWQGTNWLKGAKGHARLKHEGRAAAMNAKWRAEQAAKEAAEAAQADETPVEEVVPDPQVATPETSPTPAPAASPAAFTRTPTTPPVPARTATPGKLYQPPVERPTRTTLTPSSTITPGVNYEKVTERPARPQQPMSVMPGIRPDDFDWSKVDLAGTAVMLREKCANGLPKEIDVLYSDDVLSLAGMDREIAEAALRDPQRVVIAEETYDREKGYPVLRFHKGDATTVLGMRNPTRPKVIAVYHLGLLQHDTHRVTHTGGGGSRATSGLPKTFNQSAGRLSNMGADIDWNGLSNTVEVFYQGKSLGRISAGEGSAVLRDTVESDYQRIVRRINGIKGTAVTG